MERDTPPMRTLDGRQGEPPGLQMPFLPSLVSDVRRWMVFITCLLSTPPPLLPVPLLSVWKEAWSPLESPSQAKETLLSLGNPSTSQFNSPPLPWSQNTFEVNGQLCSTEKLLAAYQDEVRCSGMIWKITEYILYNFLHHLENNRSQ